MDKSKKKNLSDVLAHIARITNTPPGKVPQSYLFDSAFARHRLSREGEPTTPDGRPTLYANSNLDALFDGMMPDIRKDLFPAEYDLGNDQVVATPSKGDLLKEMQREGYSTATEYGFQSTRKAIAGFTGHHFDEYFRADPSKSLKVQKRMMVLKEGSFSHAFDFLRAPAESSVGSFEVTDWHALQDDFAVSRVAFLADMKAHLRLEIPFDRRIQIDCAYSAARQEMNKVENSILRAIKKTSRGNLQRYQKHLLIANDTLNKLSTPALENQPLLPLDEQMYIHCSGLEFLNYAAAWPTVYKERSPALRLKTFSLQTAGLVDSDHGPALRLHQLPSYIQERKPQLLLALTQSLGSEVTEKQLTEAVSLSQSLLRIWASGRYGRDAAITGDFDFHPVPAFVALVAVLHQKMYPVTDFQPFWHGKKSISGSLIAALEKYRFSEFAKDNTTAEAFTRVWQHHFMWFAHSFHGALPAYETKLAITRQLIKGLVPFVRYHDTALLAKRLDEYHRLPGIIVNEIDQVEAATAK